MLDKLKRMMDDEYWSSVIEPPEINDLEFDAEAFQERQNRLLLTSTPEYKKAEAERIARNKPKVHEVIEFNRVYCPVYDKARPEFLCAQEHDWDMDEPDWSEFDTEDGGGV